MSKRSSEIGKILTSSQLDVEGLNIAVSAGPPPAGATKAKGKAASRNTSLEILSDATLRLKAGQRYALIGRNGTGKSSKSTAKCAIG